MKIVQNNIKFHNYKDCSCLLNLVDHNLQATWITQRNLLLDPTLPATIGEQIIGGQVTIQSIYFLFVGPIDHW